MCCIREFPEFFSKSLFPLCRQLLPVNPLLFPDSPYSLPHPSPSFTGRIKPQFPLSPSLVLQISQASGVKRRLTPFSFSRLLVPPQHGQWAAGTQRFPGRGEESVLISKMGEFHLEQQLVSLCIFKTKHLLPWPGLIFSSNTLLSRLHRKFAFLLLTQLGLVP